MEVDSGVMESIDLMRLAGYDVVIGENIAPVEFVTSPCSEDSNCVFRKYWHQNQGNCGIVGRPKAACHLSVGGGSCQGGSGDHSSQDGEDGEGGSDHIEW